MWSHISLKLSSWSIISLSVSVRFSGTKTHKQKQLGSCNDFRVMIQREEEPPKNRERKQMTTNPISDDIFTQETVRLPEQKKRIELSAFSVN